MSLSAAVNGPVMDYILAVVLDYGKKWQILNSCMSIACTHRSILVMGALCLCDRRMDRLVAARFHTIESRQNGAFDAQEKTFSYSRTRKQVTDGML